MKLEGSLVPRVGVGTRIGSEKARVDPTTEWYDGAYPGVVEQRYP